ncbi:MAG: efflux RND transporter permease subunit [Sneathiellaceae bacterium]
MKFAAWAVSHRRFILLVCLVLAVAGGLSGLSMPVGLFPKVSFPRIVVSLDAGDRPADQMVIQVTRPVEQAMRTIPGVTSIRSKTSRGSADISVNLAWGSDTTVGKLEVESALARILPILPAGTRFDVQRMNPTVFPVAGYSLTSGASDQIALRLFAKNSLIPLLSAVPGVGGVTILGGDVPEFEVAVSIDQLAQYGLTLADVAAALNASNVLQATGRIQDLHKLFLVVADDRMRSIEDIRASVIRSGGTGQILLEDIATVRETAAPNWTIVTADGERAVLVQVYQQPDGNTVQIVKGLRQALKTIENQLPAGTKLKNWYDQSDLILASASSVRDAILIGAGLAALVLLLFLRNFKITLIALVTVPAVLAITILVLTLLGRSFNIMTLGGMAAAIGLIIDDGIVMIEQMVRGLSDRDEESTSERARFAAIEFFKPFLGSSIATVIIFAPLAFLSGVTGAFFQALSITMGAALIASFLIGWLAIPLVADRLLTQRDIEREEKRASSRDLMTRGYLLALKAMLRVPVVVLLAIAVFAAIGYFSFTRLGSGFMPAMDEGGFVLDYRTEPGTSLADTDAVIRQVEAILLATPDVETFSRRTGAQLGGGLTEANEGDFFVKLKPLPRRSIWEVMSEVRSKIEAVLPALEFDTALLMADLIGDLTAVPQPIEIKIYGDDLTKIRASAKRVARAIGEIPGLVSIQDGVVVAGDALTIRVDRTLTQLKGLDPGQVTSQLDGMLSGLVPTQIVQGPNVFDVRVWLPEAERRTVDDVGRLLLRNASGALVRLSSIAKIERVSGQPQLTRENMKAMIAVSARIDGTDMGTAATAVQAKLNGDKSLVPEPLTWELGGLYKEQQSSFIGLAIVFGAGVALVFLLTLYLYERFAVALALLLVPIFGAGAAFLALAVTGIELNISALMGLTMVLGIMTEVSIFYFSEYFRQRATGVAHQAALLNAGETRLRPILMTTLAAILALLPLAFAFGQGAQMQQPLAIAIIAGLTIQMPVVLLLMPALFHLLGGRRS